MTLLIAYMLLYQAHADFAAYFGTFLLWLAHLAYTNADKHK